MTKFKFLSLLLVALTLLTFQSMANINDNDATLCDTKVGKVKSAEIMLLKKNADGSVSTFMGKKVKNPVMWSFPGGKCLSLHETPASVAKEELPLDTNGHVTVSEWMLNHVPTIYSPKAKKVVFLVRDDRLTEGMLSSATRSALKKWHPSLGARDFSEYKEVDLGHFMTKVLEYSKVVNAQNNDPKPIEVAAKDGAHIKLSAKTSLALADKYELLRNQLSTATDKQF